MAKLTDYLDSLGVGEDGGTIYPETMVDDLRGAHDADLQGASATIAIKDALIAELEAQNMALAAANWQLSQSIPSATDVPETDEVDEDVDDEESDKTPDQFFKKAD